VKIKRFLPTNTSLKTRR